MVAYGNKGVAVLKEHIKSCILSKKNMVICIKFLFYNHKVNMKYKMESLLDENIIHDNSFILTYDEIVSLVKKSMNLMIK